jgi:hypothetical protein
MENERMPDDSATQVVSHEPAQAFTPPDLHGLRGVDPQIIMQRVAEGELLRDIAKDYGVSRAAVSMHIARHGNAEAWKIVREQSIAARLEGAIAETDQADDVVTLARARDKARLWMWRAERELPHLYGVRQQITHDIGPDLGDLLRDARKRVASPQQTIIEGSIIDVSRGDDAK